LRGSACLSFFLDGQHGPFRADLVSYEFIAILYRLYAVTGVLLSELFETRLRYSGISFGYQMAGLLAAPAPLICTALVHWARGASWPVPTYLAAIAFITFAAVYFGSKRQRIEIFA
jgi:hypothetical protein